MTTFYGTRRFITTFNKSASLVPILSQMNPINTPPPNIVSLRFILILSFMYWKVFGVVSCLQETGVTRIHFFSIFYLIEFCFETKCTWWHVMIIIIDSLFSTIALWMNPQTRINDEKCCLPGAWQVTCAIQPLRERERDSAWTDPVFVKNNLAVTYCLSEYLRTL